MCLQVVALFLFMPSLDAALAHGALVCGVLAFSPISNMQKNFEAFLNIAFLFANVTTLNILALKQMFVHTILKCK